MQTQYSEDPQTLKKTLLKYRIIVFGLTFMAYAAVHATRTAWSFSKSNFQYQTKCSDDFLGWMDSSFLFSYAISLKILGTFGDRYNLKFFVSFGMIFASIFFALIGIVGTTNTSHLIVYPFLIGLNGIGQSTNWPGLVATMGNWFGKGNRGILMGIWAGNSNVGDIIGLSVFGQLTIITFNLGYQYCIIVSGIFLFAMGIILMLFLKPYPKHMALDVQMIDDLLTENEQQILDRKQLDNKLHQQQSNVSDHDPDQPKEEVEENIDNFRKSSLQNQRQINYFTAWCLPGVAVYALAYMCLKASTYGLLFWLPYYIDNHDLKEQSSYIASMFDVGNWVGGVLTGFASDRLQKRAILMSPMLLLSTGFMFIVKFLLKNDGLPYYFVIFGVGLFLGGPYNIISSATVIDLSKQPALQGNTKALSTISALIEGLGALGAGVLLIIIPKVGQENIFFLFIALCLLASLLIMPFAIRDFQELVLKRKISTMNQKPLINADE